MLRHTANPNKHHPQCAGRRKEEANLSVTIKQISEISGVSRGTVDRVLNRRGKVSPEKEAVVRQVAQQLGYKPNLAGKALAARKKSYTIGVLLTSEGISFFDEVLRGVRQSAKEVADYGVRILIHGMRGYDSDTQIREMEALRPSVNALILNPINEPAVKDKIDEFVASGITVITLNTDVENSRRLCYVGSDYYKSGETACGMMGLMLKEEANIGILTGSVKILGHNQRISGFRDVLCRKFPYLHIVDIGETNDDDIAAFQTTQQMLQSHPEITGLFIVAAGTYGVCRAISSLGMEKQITIVCVDSVPTTQELLKSGLVKATICQQPYTQGYQSVQLASQYLISGVRPEKEKYITKNEIKISENL